MQNINQKILGSIIISLILAGVITPIPQAQAATWTAASCSQEDVQSVINSAAGGDTVLVPSGSCIWDRTLIITKGIILKSASIDQPVITGNLTPISPGNTFDERNYLIVYKPANPTLNEPFRLTGFMLDFNAKSGGVMIKNLSTIPVNNIRLDHNLFKNAGMTGGSARTILISGTVYGVIDNNYFSQNLMAITAYGSDENAWQSIVFQFGSGNCIYYEDNTFTGTTPFHDAGAASAYCARYNTYNGSASLYPWFDMHGNQPNAHTSSMGTEIYGNVLNLGSNGYGAGIFDQRGGKAIIFNNTVNTNGSVSQKVREEYDDAINPPATGPAGQPQHVSDSYFWNNRKNGLDLINASISADDFNRALGIVNNPPKLVENVTHFNHKDSFDGTAGVGGGLLTSRPATCSTGVGYWATSQSFTSVDSSNAGANPLIPIFGTLYKCTSPNTWTAYYTPYQYPHPLRTAGPTADTSSSTPVLGDINLDHIVNAVDYSILNQDWFTSNARSDLNTDGLVNSIDFSMLNANWFKTW